MPTIARDRTAILADRSLPTGAAWRLPLTIGAAFSLTGKFVEARLRGRHGQEGTEFYCDSTTATSLTVSGQNITILAEPDAVSEEVSGTTTLADVAELVYCEYAVDVLDEAGGTVLMRIQGNLDWTDYSVPSGTAGSASAVTVSVADATATTVTVSGTGSDGVSAYVYIGYASDASGSDFTTTPDETSTYVAFLATDAAIETPAADDFTGLWVPIAGSGDVAAHAALTSGVHGISAFGATLVDDANAAAARTTLGLGTAATSATGDFEAAGAVSTHAAVTSGVHGISAFGATLVDDANAAAARTTLGVDAAGTDNSTPVTLAGTLDYLTISGQQITRNAIELAADVTGTLPTTNGGTGQTSLGAVDAADLGSGAAADGYVLTADGVGGSAWEAVAGSGDVTGPASSVNGNFASFSGTGGKTLADSGSSASSFEAAGAVSTHAAVTSGVHGISAFGATLVDDANAAAARTTLGLGTAATSATGDFEAAGAVSTHAAVTSGVHGISAFGSALIDDVDAIEARATLNVDEAGTDNSIDVTLAGTPDYLTLTGQQITLGQIDLATDVTGTLPAASGGTGQTSLGAVDAADLGSGASADGYVLTSDGLGGSAWEAVAGGGTVTSVAVSGTDGLQVDSGSPITGSGTITLGVDAAALRSHINVEDGASADQTASEILTAIKTVDGTGSGLDADLLDGNEASAFATAGHNHDGTYQPLDSDLTAIAGLTPTDSNFIVGNGTSWVAESGATARASLGLGTAATSNTGDFEAAGSVSTHAAITSGVHGISAFGATLVDDADAAAARTTLGVDAAGTDNSTDVTLAGSLDYLTISGQQITRNAIDLATDITGTLSAANGGTGQTSLGAVDAADLGSGAAADGYVLTADGVGGSAWEAVAGGGTVTSVAVSGTDGIDVDSGSPITGSGTITLGINAATLSSHLSLGDAATKNTGTSAGTVAAGDHTHSAFTGDSGSGGAVGFVPAPAAGDAAAGKYLDADGTWTVPAGGGGGLAEITETLHTASPNNTVNAEQLEVTGGTTNTDLVLTPKGTGAFILGPEPDGTSTGGNKRGARAVDLQLSRTIATQVASGQDSFAAGKWGTASGLYSTTLGIQNTASGSASLCTGNGSTSSGPQSFAHGVYTSASADTAIAIGRQVSASSQAATAMGQQSLANRHGTLAHSSGGFAASGSAQTIICNLVKQTTNATPTELFLDNASARLTIASGTFVHGIAVITGSKTDGSATCRYLRQFTISNVSGTTSLVGSVITIGTDEAASTSIAITANDTNDALKIEVTGISAETWRWNASIFASETKFA